MIQSDILQDFEQDENLLDHEQEEIDQLFMVSQPFSKLQTND